jgi:C4-dicarboxylate-specific signal transduction histidine kinase
VPDSSPTAPRTGAIDLVLALCHEIGNLVGAVRLQAHLLDGDMSPRELAQTTLDMEDLCARSGVLLGHVRPLLAAPSRTTEPVAPGELIDSVCRVMARHAGPGVRLVDEAEPDLPLVEADRSVVHQLLQSLLFVALEAVASGGTVSIRAARRGDRVAFVVEDDGAADVGSDPAADLLPRGRALVCAVADAIARRHDGSCVTERRGEHTRVSLVWSVRAASP